MERPPPGICEDDGPGMADTPWKVDARLGVTDCLDGLRVDMASEGVAVRKEAGRGGGGMDEDDPARDLVPKPEGAVLVRSPGRREPKDWEGSLEGDWEGNLDGD